MPWSTPGWLLPAAAPAVGVAAVASAVAAVAAGLLVPAGLAKLRDPRRARTALGLPAGVGDHAVRAVGAGELVLAAAVLLLGGPLPHGALAAAYAAFALVAARQRARGADCGCFGAASTAPTSAGHVVLDGVAAVAAGLAALTAAPAVVPTLAGTSLLVAVVGLVCTVVAVVTAQVALTLLPALRVAGGSDGGAS